MTVPARSPSPWTSPARSNLSWDGGKYVGIGQVVGDKLAVATFDERRAVIMIMDVKADGSLEGKWWKRTDAGTKGTEGLEKK